MCARYCQQSASENCYIHPRLLHLPSCFHTCVVASSGSSSAGIVQLCFSESRQVAAAFALCMLPGEATVSCNAVACYRGTGRGFCFGHFRKACYTPPSSELLPIFSPGKLLQLQGISL